jgi:hypothetical protein
MSYILGLWDTFLVYDHNCGTYNAHYQCLLRVLDVDTDTGNICIHVVSMYIKCEYIVLFSHKSYNYNRLHQISHM